MPNPQNVTGEKRSRGRPFTSETARQARQIRTEKDKQTASVLNAFKKLASSTITDKQGNERVGAEVIAQAIFKGCVEGNARLIEVALGLLGETPDKTINVNAQVAKGDFTLEIGGEDEDADD